MVGPESDHRTHAASGRNLGLPSSHFKIFSSASPFVSMHRITNRSVPGPPASATIRALVLRYARESGIYLLPPRRIVSRQALSAAVRVPSWSHTLPLFLRFGLILSSSVLRNI